jgi:alkylhydroperoxidase family enzyme
MGLARRFGATEAEMTALESGDFQGFSAPDRAALQFSEQLTRDSHTVSEELFAELRRHFDEGEIVEIAAVAGLFNYFNRFNNAPQMEPTK